MSTTQPNQGETSRKRLTTIDVLINVGLAASVGSMVCWLIWAVLGWSDGTGMVVGAVAGATLYLMGERKQPREEDAQTSIS